MSNSATPEPGSERTLRSSVRNPRRRPRQSDAESLKTAPRRKRSKLAEDTFVPPRQEDEEIVNGTIEIASTNGDISQPTSPKRGRGRPRKTSTTTMEMSIPVREKKNSVKRPTRGDGATVLTQHEKYSVKLLPSTPKELRREGVEYRGILGAAHHALAITRERAYIWDYTMHATVTSPRIFDIPFAVKPTDPLPFGTLVATGSGTDFGLVVISATTGEVYFYESIERAASLGLFQDRKSGVAGSVGPFYSGETVAEVISADHAGFIVTLSSGRIAQLTLRDTQGRGRVFGQFLKATEQTSGGFLGGLKGFLGGSGWTKDVAAVRTRPLGVRGQQQVVSLTVRGEVQLWDLDWTGQYSFKGTVDCRELITRELKALESPEMEGQAENFTTMDFAITRKQSTSNDLTTMAAEAPIDIAVLVRSGTIDRYKYALAETSIEGTDVSVSRVIELDTYGGPPSQSVPSKPRLVFPSAHHTAFICFTDAIVLAAMEESEFNSPEAQLHSSYVEPAPFEDAVYLRQDKGLAVLGATEEDAKSSQASAIVFVKGAGLVRVSAVDPNTIARLPRTPVKSKIEQAVFHGSLQDGNIIDFSRADTASPEEVQKAALDISSEILTSSSPFLSESRSSTETQLFQKSQALSALVRHVRRTYPTLSHAAMWQLLWDAERVAGSVQIWKTYQSHIAATSQQKRKATVVDELCAWVIMEVENDKGDISSSEETVAQFLIHYTQYIEKLLPKIHTYLLALRKDAETLPSRKSELLLQANELWNEILQAAFSFRTEKSAAYGILPEFMEDGILIDAAEYVDLPEFWTSEAIILRSAAKLPQLSRELAEELYDAVQASHKTVLEQVGNQNPLLVETLCLIYQERINWLASRPSDKIRKQAEELRTAYDISRHDEFRLLASVAHAADGMRLAEKHHDLTTLAELIIAEMQYAWTERQEKGGIADPEIDPYLNELEERTNRYFMRLGDDWSNAYFDCAFSIHKDAGNVLRLAQDRWSDKLTKYLRADPSRARICWIDDIWASKDFAHAQECLAVVADDQETKLWPKKIELSMSKLALLAMQEEVGVNSTEALEMAPGGALADNGLEIVDIQDTLYQHFEPEVKSCIDKQAELEVSMAKFGFKNQDLHALRKVLEAGIERLLYQTALSVDELIDVLTLMDSNIADPRFADNVQGQEFYLALKALKAAAPSMPQGRFEVLLQLIWKRCYIYDDWVAINGKKKKSNEKIEEAIRGTIAWRTLYHALENNLFGDPSKIRHLPPSDCLGAGCSPEELEYHWPEPDILHPILNDNKIQDEQLQGYTTDRGLDQWIAACFESAKRFVEDECEDNAQQQQQEREFEESFELVDASKEHGMNGHLPVPNGLDGGAEVIEIVDEDGDGDVEMA